MPLSAGARLGPYEMLSAIGAGGMGEVYKARDTRLDRDVAIKVLPPEVSADPGRRARFLREAKTIASLNHPHICTLHDVGEHDGATYLVMEHITGETLARRLEKGPLALEQALTVATEIADALTAAHRQGVIHRDLKPGNVMLTKTGTKLLDFGLAKLTGHGEQPAAASLASAPTRTAPLTSEGAIVGTLQYMAPEQVEGKPADARSDLWALGAILYEMLTGKRAFEGASAASLIGNIMNTEPRALATLQPLTLPALDRLVRQCLAKAPDERPDTAHDVASDLRWLRETSGVGLTAGQLPHLRPLRRWGPALLLAVAALLALAVGASRWFPGRATADVMHFGLSGPENSVVQSATISPNGRMVVFAADKADGPSLLWLRAIGGSEAKPIEGSDGASQPFWSPDSRHIGYFAQGKLRRVAATGGPSEDICNAPFPRGASWGPDGTILLARNTADGLFRVPAGGGAVVRVTSLDLSRRESSHRCPSFLPDGRHFLYLCRSGRPEFSGIYVASLDGDAPRRLIGTMSNAVYAAPGYLLFASQRRLVAQPFDADRFELSGTATAVLDLRATLQSVLMRGEFSVSTTGVLINLPAAGAMQPIWYDRTGNRQAATVLRNGDLQPALSVDGRIAASGLDPETLRRHIWVFPASPGPGTRFTFGDSNQQYPVWSPDGARIAYATDRNGHWDIYGQDVNGTSTEEQLLASGESKYPSQWCAHPAAILYDRESTEGRRNVWLLPLTGARKPTPVLSGPADEWQARVSPDGHWIAYT